MGLLRKVGEVILINIALLGFLLLAPAIYLIFPFVLIATEPNGKHDLLATVYILLGPFVASAWMVITRMVSRYRRITADGTPYERSLKGVGIACVWMVIGFVVSAIAEFIFLLVWRVPRSNGDWLAWFAVAPFVVFSPVILGWVLRNPWRE